MLTASSEAILKSSSELNAAAHEKSRASFEVRLFDFN
jgi:hypothetical protein